MRFTRFGGFLFGLLLFLQSLLLLKKESKRKKKKTVLNHVFFPLLDQFDGQLLFLLACQG